VTRQRRVEQDLVVARGHVRVGQEPGERLEGCDLPGERAGEVLLQGVDVG
jgi:hypothetical protein